MNLDNILANIDKLSAVIAAFVALILAAVAGYQKIRDALRAKATDALSQAAIPLIAQAETQPLSLLKELVTKPDVNPVSNEGKNSIVVQALREREPKLLKKLKLSDAIQIGEFITGLYKFVKPIIKIK